MRATAMRRAARVGALVVLVLFIAGVWTGDGRWGLTALIVLVPAVLLGFVAAVLAALD